MDSTTARSAHPRDYKPSKDGSISGRIKEIRKALVPKFGEPGRMVEKPLAELELDGTGEPITVWLEGVLASKFRDELARRVQLGRSSFEPDEHVDLNYLGKRMGRNGFEYDDFDPVFEHAAPPPTAAEILLGPLGDPDAPVHETGSGDADDDSIPF